MTREYTGRLDRVAGYVSISIAIPIQAFFFRHTPEKPGVCRIVQLFPLKNTGLPVRRGCVAIDCEKKEAFTFGLQSIIFDFEGFDLSEIFSFQPSICITTQPPEPGNDRNYFFYHNAIHSGQPGIITAPAFR